MVSFAFIASIIPLLATTVMSVKMGAVGIAVSNIPRSQAFYEKTLGLKPNGMTFDTPEFSEVVLTLPGTGTGSALVLMQWKTPKQTQDIPVKLVFYVDDMKATWAKMKEVGAKVVSEPGSLRMKNTTIPTAFVRDPDGYSVELNPMSLLAKTPSRMAQML